MKPVAIAIPLLLLSLVTAACDDDPGFDTGLDGNGSGDADGDADTDVDGEGDCAALDDHFEQEWAAFEQQVLDLVNQRRSQGANCGAEGSFGPAQTLTMQNQLRAAARRHSMDMGLRGYFDHMSPGGPCGNNPWERIETAGYAGFSTAGENIAAGYGTAEQVMAGWMGSPGHCANIMHPAFRDIGVGYAEVPGSPFTIYWTQKFGAKPGN